MITQEQLKNYRVRVEKILERVLEQSGNTSNRLHQAMRYVMLNGGKRLRPILVYATGECFGQSLDQLDLIAASVECIHGYSLIHDDLPAMDDDDLRRGKPTCHIAFDEATAILAGDALQSLAFELIATSNNIKLVKILAESSGASGMVGGQMLDLQAEGKKISRAELENIHFLKTGALIQASVTMGAVAAGVEDEATLNTLKIFSQSIGLAFQLQDDLLDVIGEEKNIGKNIGQDIKLQKSTYAILEGVDATRARVESLTKQAIAALKTLTQNTATLEMIAYYLMNRNG